MDLISVCPTCFQPECPESHGGDRGTPGALPEKIEPGHRTSRGYGEWAVHPLEAVHVLHRGYVNVNGEPRKVRFIQNEAFVTQIAVEGTSTNVNHHMIEA